VRVKSKSMEGNANLPTITISILNGEHYLFRKFKWKLTSKL